MAQDKDNKNLNVPPLRFPGFTDEWKENPLNQLVERVTRKNKNEESKVALTISAQYGLVHQEAFFNNKVASSDLSHYYLLYKGEYAYNKSYSSGYPWGTVKRLNQYDKGVVSTLYICFRPLDTVDSDFIGHYFESSKWHKGVSEIAVEGARNHGLLNIGVKDFFSTTHFVPSLDEQKKIAKVLSLIDDRIATQNKIIDNLQSLIKGLRDKLLREWCIDADKVRLGDICNITTGKLDANAMEDNGIFPFFTCAESPYSINTYAFDTEALLISGNGANVGYINYYKGKFNAYQRTYILDNFNENIQYVRAYLKSYLPKRINLEKSTSNTPYIVMSTLSDMIIDLPDKAVQYKICNIINSLETKLSIEGKVLSSLIMTKKSLLSNLFI